MRIVALVMSLCLIGCEDHSRFDSGRAAYQQGRFDAALSTFSELEQARGSEASAELVFNRGLAALGAGQPTLAETCAEKAAARGGEPFFGLRDFILGNTAFARCELAAAEAILPNSDPIAFDMAIRAAEAARSHWQSAANSRARWPEADRNVALARRKLEELRRKKLERLQKKDKRKRVQEIDPEEEDPQKQKEPEKKTDEKPTPQPNLRNLSAAELQELLSKLDKKEKEKRALRYEQQRKLHVAGRKDW